MPTNVELIKLANDDIIASVSNEISELHLNTDAQATLDAVIKELQNLLTLGGIPGDLPHIGILAQAVERLKKLRTTNGGSQDFGAVLGDLDTLKNLISRTPGDPKYLILQSVITRIEAALNRRPDAAAVLSDLEAIKNLRGGPADATAFHDFHVLQLAFKNIWIHAFDANLFQAAETLFNEAVQLYADAGLQIPSFDSIADVDDLNKFIKTVQNLPEETTPKIPSVVYNWFAYVLSFDGLDIDATWSKLSNEQRSFFVFYADLWQKQFEATQKSPLQIDEKLYYRVLDLARDILKNPAGRGGKLAKLILEIGNYLSEPYAFDVFAPDSYNYGIMLTYRQKWEPGPYQAGDLRSTITMAPGETRKYSKKTSVKVARAQKEIEKSMASRSEQSSVVSRAEAEIMLKATTATNFKMTSDGSFNIGVGEIHASSEFGLKQGLESTNNKRAFHEATLKAAEEYRLERSLEVDTTSSTEFETTTSGEISNPNTEITVTYLFYELQRRYTVTEVIYRARPVLLVAQKVPAPHEIDEAWLIANQWIIARVLLDDSFRPALTALTSGMAGDEVALNVVKAHWQDQKGILTKLENQVTDQLTMRDSLRETIVQSALQKKITDEFKMPDVAKVLSLGLAPDPGQMAADTLQAYTEAAKARLQYVEEALSDAQAKYKQAADSYQRATDQYSEALQKEFNRRIQIDQLRVHVKQNIFYYMQAIWAHEDPHQRFFRLYNKQVLTPDKNGTPFVMDMVELADLDNPIGYKGNYIIFPIKKPTLITNYMLHQFVDENFGIRDPDPFGNFTAEELEAYVNEQLQRNDLGTQDKQKLKSALINYLSAPRQTIGDVIVPTGQLFIEALTGSHPLLEDFKLLHRVEDVRKVKAEVRHAELENLRLAARLAAAASDPKNLSMLEDPDIEKRIIIDGNASVLADTN